MMTLIYFPVFLSFNFLLLVFLHSLFIFIAAAFQFMFCLFIYKSNSLFVPSFLSNLNIYH